MKWERLPNGDWIARGKYGDFLVWKDGRTFKARYRSIDHVKIFFLPIKRNMSAAKAVCENNYHWE